MPPEPKPSSVAAPECRALSDLPFSLKDQYSTVALISHPKHLGQLNKTDHSTLIVSCNWLLWQQAVADGWHCIHTDSLPDKTDMKSRGENVFLRACDWMYKDSDDYTLFHDVSLGTKFLREVSLALLERKFLSHICSTLITKYGTSAILFFDLFSEFSVVEPSVRRAYLSDICERRLVRFEDRSSDTDPDDPLTSQVSTYAQKPNLQPTLKRKAMLILNRAYETVMDALGKIRIWIGKSRPSFLLVTSHSNGRPLLESFQGVDVYPLYLTQWMPNKTNIRLWAHNIVKGIIPVRLIRASLSEKDTMRLEEIKNNLNDLWAEDDDDDNQFIYNYVRQKILSQDRFVDIAIDICSAEELLKAHRPVGVFSDSMQGALSTSFLELAGNYNSKTFATWTAHAVLDVKLTALGSDERNKPIVDYFLSWGKGHDDWLQSNDAKVAPVRTGSQKSIIFKQMARTKRAGTKILLLQHSVSYYDPRCERSRQYSFFVETVRMLEEIGISEIHFKLHPSLSVNAGYFEKIIEHFGLNCTIVHDGDFREHVEWSDIVIGPVNSAAMLEVMATEKPYYPILLAPHSINLKYLNDCPLYKNVGALREALENKEKPECAQTLEYFTSSAKIENPAEKSWQAIRTYTRLS